jgi:hypothetical protein
MNTVLAPTIDQFNTAEQAASYDTWFRVKVQQAIDSKEPHLEHDDLVAEMDALIAEIEANLAV